MTWKLRAIHTDDTTDKIGIRGARARARGEGGAAGRTLPPTVVLRDRRFCASSWAPPGKASCSGSRADCRCCCGLSCGSSTSRPPPSAAGDNTLAGRKELGSWLCGGRGACGAAVSGEREAASGSAGDSCDAVRGGHTLRGGDAVPVGGGSIPRGRAALQGAPSSPPLPQAAACIPGGLSHNPGSWASACPLAVLWWAECGSDRRWVPVGAAACAQSSGVATLCWVPQQGSEAGQPWSAFAAGLHSGGGLTAAAEVTPAAAASAAGLAGVAARGAAGAPPTPAQSSPTVAPLAGDL